MTIHHPTSPRKSLILNIYLVYLPPDLNTAHCQAFYDKCVNTLLNLKNVNSKTIIIGDFNVPGLSWSIEDNSHGLVPSSAYDTKSSLLLNLLELGGLLQFNHVCNSNERILDQFLTDLNLMYQ